MALNAKKESPSTIVILAGESSGDFLGARLMKSLKEMSQKPLVFEGTGGPLMHKEGLQPYGDISSLSIMGFFVGPCALLTLKKMLHHITKRIMETRPAVVITIDFPGFNFRIAKNLQETTIPLAHYVAPTVWAWRPKRAEKIAKLYDHLFCLFDFEPPYFEKHHLQTTFVGHPLVEIDFKTQKKPSLRETYKILPTQKILVMLPGSRFSEVKKHLPLFQKTYNTLLKKWPHLVVFIPTVPFLESFIKEHTRAWKGSVHISTCSHEKIKAFQEGDVALAASGTVTLELAMAGIPMIVAYKTSWLNAQIAKAFLKTAHVSLVNILAKKEIVPEFLQENCREDHLAKALEELLTDTKKRNAQKQAFSTIKSHIMSQKGSPSTLVATKILEMIKTKD